MVASALAVPPSAGAATAPGPPSRDAAPADAVVSAEHPVADPVESRRHGDQSQVAVASDGEAFLVVWRDSPLRGISAGRVGPGGEILDPIDISVTPEGGGRPAVSWDGTNYLVVWEQRDRGLGSTGVFGARVTPEGSVLDPDPITIATGRGRGSPAVAFNGTHHLVVWDAPDEDVDWERDLYGARIDPAGTVVDPVGIPIATGPGQHGGPAVASDGVDFLVVWTDGSYDEKDIFAGRVSAGGVVLDGEGFAVTDAPSGQWAPAVAWDGSHYLTAWTDDRGEDDSDVIGARVSPSGAVDGPELVIAGGPEDDFFPSLASSGAGAYVVWGEYPRARAHPGEPPPWSVLGLQVEDGVVVGSPQRIGTGTDPAVAFNGTDHLVPWSVEQYVLPGPFPPQNDVFAARVSGAGSLLDDPALHLTPQANSQRAPAVAWNGDTYLAVWEDYRPRPEDPFGPVRHYFGRVSPTGEILDGGGTALSRPTGRGPVVAASNGDGFLLAWTVGAGIAGVRVDAGGRLVDPEPFTIPPGPGGVAAGHLAVASDGSDYLAVWNHNNVSEGYRSEVVGARIPAAGTPGGTVVPVSGGDGWAPALAWNGESYLVAWRRSSGDAKGPPASRGPGIAAVRVDRAGTVLDRRPTVVPQPDGVGFSRPGVAAGNGTFLVAWNSRPDDYSWEPRTEGVRVDARGRVLDRSPVVLATGTVSYEKPRLSWDGVHYLVVWMDEDGPYEKDVLAARVSEAGTVLDPEGFVVAGAPDVEAKPVVTSGPHGRSAVVYERQAFEAPYYGAYRVFLRFVDST